MPLRFSLRQIEYFVAVGEAGSIAMAAERIRISSPSISAAISQLEQEFGLQLFVRQHAQGLTLTPGGRRFMQEAKLLLETADRLHDLAGDITDMVKGPVNIGCLVTLAPYLLAKIRSSFQEQHPETNMRQVIEDHASLMNRISRAEIDVALTYDLDIPQDIEFEPLASLPPYALVSEDHPLADRDEVSLEELATLPMVLLDLPISRDYFLGLFNRAGLKPNIGDTIRQMAVLRSMVANGLGYGLLSVRPKTDLSPDGQPLRHIRLAGDLAPLTVGTASIKGAYKSASIRALLDHCRESIAEDNIPGIDLSEL